MCMISAVIGYFASLGSAPRLWPQTSTACMARHGASRLNRMSPLSSICCHGLVIAVIQTWQSLMRKIGISDFPALNIAFMTPSTAFSSSLSPADLSAKTALNPSISSTSPQIVALCVIIICVSPYLLQKSKHIQCIHQVNVTRKHDHVEKHRAQLWPY